MKDEIGAAMVLNNLGNLLQAQGNYQEAQGYYIQSSEIFKTQDHVHGAATTLGNAGKLAGRQGDYKLAEKLLSESLVLKRKINDQRGEAVALAGLGDVGLLVKDYSEAKTQFFNALKLAKQIGDAQLMLDILAAFALLADEQNQIELCGNLLSYILNHSGTPEEARQRVVKLKDKYSQENGKWNQEAVEDVVTIVLGVYK
jgi:Tfp pilus assembly protein PilF